MQKTRLSIDIETFSSISLQDCGVFKYVESPDFDVLICVARLSTSEELIISALDDPGARASKKRELILNLLDEEIEKTAYNAQFERTCLAKWLGVYLPPEQWTCTMVRVANLGLPLSLDAAANALGLEVKKDTAGKELIKFFSTPRKPTVKNPSTRNYPTDHIEKFNKFIAYCIQDVNVEEAILEKTKGFKQPDFEHVLWCTDQRINETGVRVDLNLINSAIELNDLNAAKLIAQVTDEFGISATSNAQVKKFIEMLTGTEIKSLNKKSIADVFDLVEGDKRLERLLALRSELTKSSVSKFKRMLDGACADGRLKGIAQFYGANRTGRWAGRLIQPQNLPSNKTKGAELEYLRCSVLDRDIEAAETLGFKISDALVECIRPALIPSEGCKFIASDFTAIEAVVLSHLAGEKWRLDVFKNKGDIYIASVSKMFGIPATSIDKNTKEGKALRQKGKVAELALGYQGGVNALITMGALAKGSGLVESDLQGLVNAWRNANPNIKKFWYEMQDCMIKACKGEAVRHIRTGTAFRLSKSRDFLLVTLPSGRQLSYFKPQISEGAYGDIVSYLGVDKNTNVWKRLPTYGGKIVENIVQAVSRDCLAVAMVRLEQAGYKIVMHIHDEVVIDCPNIDIDKHVERVNSIMAQPIDWLPNIPLSAASSIFDYYQKD